MLFSDSGDVDSDLLKSLLMPEQKAEQRLPETEVEMFLCQLWADLLECESVGVEDNFFALGGHSLLTTRLISAIRSEFNVDLSIPSIFENPTIQEVGKLISLQQHAQALNRTHSALEQDENEIEEGVL